MNNTQTLAEEVAAFHNLRDRKDRAAAEARALKEEYDLAEIALFERMEHEGVTGIKLDGVGNFVKAETTFGKVQDRSEFVAWAQEEMPELLETKERKKLINELARERIDSGQPLPPGLGFYVEQYISRRAA